METIWLEKLIGLQQEIGYTQGNINAVALLGVFGEAGEVLNEVTATLNSEHNEFIYFEAIRAAGYIDQLKKKIRDKDAGTVMPTFELKNPGAFDRELADQFYYILALAQNRGLTLDNLAEISCKKIAEKRLQVDIKHGAPAADTEK